MPTSKEERRTHAEMIGADGEALLSAIYGRGLGKCTMRSFLHFHQAIGALDHGGDRQFSGKPKYAATLAQQIVESHNSGDFDRAKCLARLVRASDDREEGA